jgi:hypothetical protein
VKGRLSVQPGTAPDAAHSLERVRKALERRYRVERELGSGRTGTVYLAYERRRGRKVAIRVLAPSLAADPEKREAFVRAAKAVRFPDPSRYMVGIRRVGHAAGIVYATMDYVDGETLGERVRREGPLTVGAATRMLYDVARGVACAHANGVILGATTPDDIILERTTGRAVVTDVGIASALAGSGADRAAYRAARAPFVSPEQVQGAAGGGPSDIYALGVTAYFAVTGYLPFEGETPEEIFVGHVVQQAPGLRLYNKLGKVTYTDLSVHRRFADVVRTCLNKDPAARFNWGPALADALEFAPEIGRYRSMKLRIFPEMLQLPFQPVPGVPLVALYALVALVIGAVTGEARVVAFGAAILVVSAAVWMDAVLGETRSLLAFRYSRADMIRAFRIDAESEQELAALENAGLPLAHFRISRRVKNVGVVLAGVGAAVTLIKPLPPVGWLLIWIGAPALVVVAGISGLVPRSTFPSAQFWFAVWRSRVGAWIVRLAGWRLETRPAPRAARPEIAMLWAPSFEERQRQEATREMVNLAPAMQHRVASRINAIRACLNAEAFATDPRLAKPPLDRGMRARLKQCLERLQLVRYRLGAVRIGENRRRLVWEYQAVERACGAADGLLAEAGASRSGPHSGRC